MLTQGVALAAHFGNGRMTVEDVAAGVVGAVIKDPIHDNVVWREYLEGVVRDRPGWADFYTAARSAGE